MSYFWINPKIFCFFRLDESPPASNQDNNSSARQVLELEREALELRRELQDTRAKKEEADQKLQQ